MNIDQFLEQHSNLNLVSDSRLADSDSIFFALRGSKSDGHKFIESVYFNGCRHFVVEDDLSFKKFDDVQFVKVQSSSSAWAKAWKLNADKPDENLFLVGVTGTNGKTSITLMIEHILNLSQKPCGVLGTIDHHLKLNQEVHVWPTSLTTPGSEILYPRLNEMLNKGAKSVALEISSHALDQDRATELSLDSAIFSNFTNDHLDYHKTMGHYFSSKVKLFEQLLQLSNKKNKVSVLNYMDPYIKTYLPEFGGVEVLVEVSDIKKAIQENWVLDLLNKLKSKNPMSKLNLVQLDIHNLNGLSFTLALDVEINNQSSVLNTGLNSEFKTLKFNLPILGHFQMMNWCQAVLSLTSLNLSDQVLMSSAQSFSGVPGRLQKVLNSKDKAVFVDYAHTPDALKRTLQSLKEICSGQLGVVFGCGGDRDAFKRPVMGQVASEFADFQIITNDNPRGEDPDLISKQIADGFKSKVPVIELDRRKAIDLGLRKINNRNDILLIAGKGHENYQILKDRTIDFSDYQTVMDLLED